MKTSRVQATAITFSWWAAGMTPLIWILWQVYRLQGGEWDVLGPEPGRAIVFFTGDWALYCLIATLAATTLSRRFSISLLVRRRRMLGLLVFLYGSLHLLAYATFLLEWDWRSLGEELTERRYLTLGMLAWGLLLPLAITSTKGWQKRLGRDWKRLHRLVYIAAILVTIHYLLQIRANWLEPVVYSLLLVALLLERWWHTKQREKRL